MQVLSEVVVLLVLKYIPFYLVCRCNCGDHERLRVDERCETGRFLSPL